MTTITLSLIAITTIVKRYWKLYHNDNNMTPQELLIKSALIALNILIIGGARAILIH